MIDLAHFLHPDTVRRNEIPLAELPAPAPKQQKQPLTRPAWAKSGDEIFAKLDAFNARFPQQRVN